MKSLIVSSLALMMCSISFAAAGSIETEQNKESVSVQIHLSNYSDAYEIVGALLKSPQFKKIENMYIDEKATVVRSLNELIGGTAKPTQSGHNVYLQLKLTDHLRISTLGSSMNGTAGFVRLTDRSGSDVDKIRTTLMTASGPNVRKYFSSGRDDYRVANAVIISFGKNKTSKLDCFPSFERNYTTCKFQLSRD